MAAPHAELPKLTAADIEALTDPTSFSRGKTYHRRGMITHPVRRGTTLAGTSLGSSGGPYQVRATLATSGAGKVADWSCTCPRGGFCKHIVALLLTWIERPEAFAVRTAIDELLAGQDREALIAIILKLTSLEPELELVIEKVVDTLAPPVPLVVEPAKPGEAAAVTVSVKDLRRRLDEAIDDMGGEEEWYDAEWGYDGGPSAIEEYLAGEAGTVDVDTAFAEEIAAAERYEQAGRLADAAASYGAIASLGIGRFEDVYESEEVHRQILAAGRGLVRCLERQASLPEGDRLHSRERAELIDALYEIWFFAGHGQWEQDPNVERTYAMGSVTAEGLTGPGLTGAIVAALSDEEKRELDRRWRADAANLHAEEWHRRTAIAFGIALNEPGGLRDGEVLDLLTRAELWWDQALFLLEHGRPDEATNVAARKLTDPSLALGFASNLYSSADDGPARAIRFVDERLWETEGKMPAHDTAYLNWLAGAYAKTGQPAEALDARQRVFKFAPDLSTYQALREAATHRDIDPGRWPDLRKAALSTLDKKGDSIALMEIHLAEGEIGEAIALLDRDAKTKRQSTDWTWYGGLSHYRSRVAEAAERDRPDDAIRLYRQLADELIAHKQRTSYTQAATHLAAVRRVLAAHNRTAEWETLIGDLRAEHRRLPALQQELDFAGL